MSKRFDVFLTVLVLFAFLTPLMAHHGNAIYDESQSLVEKQPSQILVVGQPPIAS